MTAVAKNFEILKALIPFVPVAVVNIQARL